MRFPRFLGPFVPLPQFATALDSETVDRAIRANSLPFVMQTQDQDNWCWAATTSSISGHFDPNSQWTQCKVASSCLESACCAAPEPCDVVFTLDGPLRRTGNLQDTSFPTHDSQERLQAQLDNRRPVCCHITWVGGKGHFVAISGYDLSTGDVFVQDPLYGPDTVPFDVFISTYRGTGTWDHTYYTQPKASL